MFQILLTDQARLRWYIVWHDCVLRPDDAHKQKGAVNMQSLFLLGTLRHLDAVQPRTNMSSDGWLIDLRTTLLVGMLRGERQDDIMFLGPEGIVTFWRIYIYSEIIWYMYICLLVYVVICSYSYIYIYMHTYSYSNGETCSIATVLGHFLASNSSFHTCFGISQLLSPCGWQGYQQHQP